MQSSRPILRKVLFAVRVDPDQERDVRKQFRIVVCAASLLLSIATAALWIRSYWRADMLFLTRDAPDERPGITHEWSDRFYLEDGTIIYVSHNDKINYAGIPPRGIHFAHGSLPAQHGNYCLTVALIATGYDFKPVLWRGFGFYFDRSGNTFQRDKRWMIGAPMALPTTLLAFPPMFAAYRALRRARATFRSRNSFCVACGYDLRATPGRCPECGRPSPAKS